MTRVALISATIAACVFVASAVASGPAIAWTTKDMKTAIRGLGYPKPHPKKLACKGIGQPVTAGSFLAFNCVATYRHHRHRRFTIAGEGQGGWLCADKPAMPCKLLRHGFITNRQATADGSLAFVAEQASRGYMANVYNDPQPYVSSPCAQSGQPSTWTFCYRLDVGSVDVNITLRHVKTGYVASAAATKQS